MTTADTARFQHLIQPDPGGASLDVLVVGAGTTGLALAIELARRGVAFRIVDSAPGPRPTSRALGTQARTEEVFQMMGIPPETLTPALRVRALTAHIGTEPFIRLPFEVDLPDRAFDGLLAMSQNDTEHAMRERLDALGARIEWGVSLTALVQDSRQITASLTSASGSETVNARFLIGCDGARSDVRRQIGISFDGDTYDQSFLLVDGDIQWRHPHDEARFWLHPEGVFGALPLVGEHRWRLIASHVTAPGASPEAAAGVGEMAGWLTERTGDPTATLSNVTWVSNFRLAHRIVPRMQVERVFLAGDAAHIHSPMGAQGMNTGIQDAFNLGWKLALAARGHAAPGLLETYGEERLPIARGVVDITNAGMGAALSTSAWQQAARNRLVDFVASSPGLRNRLTRQISQLDLTYRHGPLARPANPLTHVKEWGKFTAGSPRAGDRAPQAFATRLPGASPANLFELYASGSWNLLLFPNLAAPVASCRELATLAREVTESLGDAMQPVLILPPWSAPETLPWETPTLYDTENAIRRVFGPTGEAAVLIRPDGYLGARIAPVSPSALWDYLSRIFHPGLLPIGEE